MLTDQIIIAKEDESFYISIVGISYPLFDRSIHLLRRESFPCSNYGLTADSGIN